MKAGATTSNGVTYDFSEVDLNGFYEFTPLMWPDSAPAPVGPPKQPDQKEDDS